MLSRVRVGIVLLVLLAGGGAVMVGEVDDVVGFSSVLEIWSDVLRDADQFGLKLTRVSDQEEMRLGHDLAQSVGSQWRTNQDLETYVSGVADRLIPHVRRTGITYHFQVIDADAINAFALPGGQIFVAAGLVEFAQSEAELAAVLGHEMAHVDLRHCIERYQYQLALETIGAGEIGQLAELARRLVAIGYTKYQELEADTEGVRLSIAAGYQPEAAEGFFTRLMQERGEQAPQRAATPVGEVVGAMGQAMGSYLDSHPSSFERTRRLNNLVARNRRRLAETRFYVGRENHRQRIPRDTQEFPGEFEPIATVD